MSADSHLVDDRDRAPTLEKVSAERDHYRKLYLDMLERCKLLERGSVIGKKAERFEGATPQLALDMLDMLLGAPPAEQDTEPSPAPGPRQGDGGETERHGGVR